MKMNVSGTGLTSILSILCGFLLQGQVWSQSTVMQSEEGDTAGEAKARVLVVPFHQIRYYFSDCDKQIAERNKMQLPEIRQSFMLGMDYATENRLDKEHEPLNLAQMRDSIDKAYFAQFYDNVSYAYEAPTRSLTLKQKGGKKKKSPAKIGKKTGGKGVKLGDAGNYTTLESADEQYMRLKWTKPEFLQALATTYELDYIITINQFEIKTNYEKCIDRELGKYARTIKIHYNIFRPDGELLQGEVVSAHYNSTKDDINAIIQDNFGVLADFVMQSLPKK